MPLEQKRLAFIIHPLGGKKENIEAVKEILKRYPVEFPDVVPVASHLAFATWLDDTNPKEREIGIGYGNRLMEVCQEAHVWGNWQESRGSKDDIAKAKRLGLTIRYFDKVE